MIRGHCVLLETFFPFLKSSIQFLTLFRLAVGLSLLILSRTNINASYPIGKRFGTPELYMTDTNDIPIFGKSHCIFMHTLLNAALVFARKCFGGHVIIKPTKKILKVCAAIDIKPRVRCEFLVDSQDC